MAKDQTEMFAGQTPKVIAFVLDLSFLLLLVVFHSLAIPTLAIFLTPLSAGAAFGVMQLVFGEGWFGDLLDVTASPVESFIEGEPVTSTAPSGAGPATALAAPR
jgi:uncharacterized membrane protein YdfJ with MMPL/SSD domain